MREPRTEHIVRNGSSSGCERLVTFIQSRLSSGVVLVALLSACGSGSSSDDPSDAAASNDSCELTLSGGIELTTGCSPQIVRIGANVSKKPTLMIGAQSDIIFGFQILDVTTEKATYENEASLTTFGSIADKVEPGAPQRSWQLSQNYPGSDESIGTYTAKVSAVSLVAESADYANWNVDGTVDAVYQPNEDSGATGETTVHIEF